MTLVGRRSRRALALTLSVGLTSCADGNPRAGGRAWTADSIPSFVVADTSLSAEPTLLHPAGATRLSNGNIVAVDPYAFAIRYFDPAGRLIRTVGRAGQGPNEFSAPWWLGQCGVDSVFVYDRMKQLMAVLDSAGNWTRSYTPDVPPISMACSRRGDFILQAPAGRIWMPTADATPHLRGMALLANALGDTIGSLGEIPYAENRPLGKVTTYALTDDAVYIATAESAFFDVYSRTGERRGAIEAGGTPQPPTERNYDRVLDQWVAGFPAADDRANAKRMMRDRLPPPDLMPVYFGIFTDPDGVLWVLLSAPGDPVTRLRPIRPDGNALPDVEVPAALTVFEIGRDYILGSYPDSATGAHMLASYRLRRE